MSRRDLSRSVEKIEAYGALLEQQEARAHLESLTELELLEIAAANGDGGALCAVAEPGCDCKRKAWKLLGPDRSYGRGSRAPS